MIQFFLIDYFKMTVACVRKRHRVHTCYINQMSIQLEMNLYDLQTNQSVLFEACEHIEEVSSISFSLVMIFYYYEMERVCNFEVKEIAIVK